MRNENDRHILFFHDAADHIEQFIRFLRGEHSGRLVKDKHISTRSQGLQNLHALLQTHAQIAHSIGGLHLQAVGLAQFAHAADGLGLVIKQTFLRLMPQHDVLRHGKAGHQLKVLMHHAHAQTHGIFGIVLRARAIALDVDFAQRGTLHAVEQIHQRAFAGAVFAHQSKHLTPADGEAYVVIGQRAWILLAHTLKAYDLVGAHGTLLTDNGNMGLSHLRGVQPHSVSYSMGRTVQKRPISGWIPQRSRRR